MALGRKVGGQGYFHDLPCLLGRYQHRMVEGHGLDKVDSFCLHGSLIDMPHLLARHGGKRENHSAFHCVKHNVSMTVVDQQSTVSSHKFDCCC